MPTIISPFTCSRKQNICFLLIPKTELRPVCKYAFSVLWQSLQIELLLLSSLLWHDYYCSTGSKSIMAMLETFDLAEVEKHDIRSH